MGGISAFEPENGSVPMLTDIGLFGLICLVLEALSAVAYETGTIIKAAAWEIDDTQSEVMQLTGIKEHMAGRWPWQKLRVGLARPD